MLKLSPSRALLAAVLAYVALWLITPKVGFLPPVILLVISTLVFMAVQIAIVYFYSALNWRWWQSLATLAVCLITALALGGIVKVLVGPGGKVSGYFGLLRIPMTLLMIFAAASIGCAVAERVKDRNLLLPVVMFAAYIDFWTVTRGPVAAMLAHAPNLAQAVSAPIPMPGRGAFEPVTLIGPGDFLFMGLVFGAVNRLKMNGRRNYWFVFALMTLAMLCVALGVLGFVPALIVLAVAVVAANWGEFKLTRQEAVSMVIVGVLLFGSLPLIWSLLAPKTKPKPAHKSRPPVTAPQHSQPR